MCKENFAETLFSRRLVNKSQKHVKCHYSNSARVKLGQDVVKRSLSLDILRKLHWDKNLRHVWCKLPAFFAVKHHELMNKSLCGMTWF